MSTQSFDGLAIDSNKAPGRVALDQLPYFLSALQGVICEMERYICDEEPTGRIYSQQEAYY